MENKKKTDRRFVQGILWGVAFSLVIVLIAMAVYLRLTSLSSIRNLIDLGYGDSFEAVNVYDETGTASELPLSSGSTVVFYLSSFCGSCIDSLSQYKAINQIWGDKINTCIIWHDDIPSSLINKNSISIAENYSLHQEVTLSVNKPTFYIVEDGKITFLTYDLKTLEQKMLENKYMDNAALQDSAFRYITDKLSISDTEQTLIYFCMDGCQDCEHADELLSQKRITQQYIIKRIYRSDTNLDGVFVDENDLLSTIFGITWYPSFLIYRGEGAYQIVGKISDQELLDVLLK